MIDIDLPAGLDLEQPVFRAVCALAAIPRAARGPDLAASLEVAATRCREAATRLETAAARLRPARSQ